MKLVVSRAALLSVLGPVAAITNRRSPAPFGSCALLRAAVNVLTLESSDSTSNCRATLPAEVDRQGSVAVPAEDLVDRIALLAEGPVTLEYAKEKLSIRQGKRTYVLRTMSSAGFPPFPVAPAETTTLRGQAIATVLDGAAYAMTDDDTRARFAGIELTAARGRLSATASDGRARFIRTSVDCTEALALFVPYRAVRVLQRAIGTDDPSVQVGSTDVRAFAKVVNHGLTVEFAYSLPEIGSLPYDELFAMYAKTDGPSVARRELISKLRAVTPAGVGGVTPVWLYAGGTTLRLEHVSAENDVSEDELPLSGAGSWKAVAEGKYLLDALTRMVGEEVTIAVVEREATHPIVLRTPSAIAMVARMDPAIRASNDKKEAA